MSAVKDEEAKGAPTKSAALDHLDSTTWPGVNMTQYQFPQKDHPFLRRAVATTWVDMLEITREHGEKFNRHTTGNYPSYSCPQCEGMMRVQWEAGKGGSGKVTKSTPCVCAQKSGSDNECDELNKLYGHVLLRIAKKDFVQSYWRRSVNCLRADSLSTESLRKKRKGNNNGHTSTVTFATKARKLWELTTKKESAEGAQDTFKVVSLVSHNLDDDNDNEDTVEEDKTIGASGQCLFCFTHDIHVELLCRGCIDAKGTGAQCCYPCFNKWTSTRISKPLNLHFHTDYVLIHKADGYPCPMCRESVTEAYHNKNRVSAGIRMPFGWIGERPERNKRSYEKTMETYNVIVRPYVEAYSEAKTYEMQAEEVHAAYLKTRDQMESSISAAYVEREDAKYAHMFEALKEAMEHYRNKVSEHKWLELNVTEGGCPPDVPGADLELAKKGVPIDVAGKYPGNAELVKVKAEISIVVNAYNGAGDDANSDVILIE